MALIARFPGRRGLFPEVKEALFLLEEGGMLNTDVKSVNPSTGCDDAVTI